MSGKITIWAVVLEQPVEQFLPTPQVHGSNLVIGKFLCIPPGVLKRQNEEKEVGTGPIVLNILV